MLFLEIYVIMKINLMKAWQFKLKKIMCNKSYRFKRSIFYFILTFNTGKGTQT